MDFNDLELRISILYRAINTNYSFNYPVIPQTREYEENGKKYFQVIIDGGNITTDEVLDANNRIIHITHQLANLKDNLKNYLSKKSVSGQIVEDNINNSQFLSIITDLSNSDKHGYPTNSKRSRLDPKIVNVRKGMQINNKLAKVFYDVMDSRIVFTADIVDFNDNFICDFNDLIEKAIENWEDFLINNINEVSQEIILIRNAKELKKNEILKVQHIIDEVHKILNSSEWIDVSWQELVVGMIVRIIQRESNLTNTTGIIVEQFKDENSLPTIKLKDDSPFRIINFQVEKYNWQVIKIFKPNDLMVLSYYYYNCDILFQSVK